jgi:hypothetical protein
LDPAAMKTDLPDKTGRLIPPLAPNRKEIAKEV